MDAMQDVNIVLSPNKQSLQISLARDTQWKAPLKSCY